MHTVLTCVLLSLGGSVFGATLRVPSQFSTIQAAADAARSGDTVLVAPGEYTSKRAIEVAGKRLSIESEGGADSTVLRIVGVEQPTDWSRFSPFEGQRLSVIVVEGPEASGTRLAGFTLTGGFGTSVTPSPDGDSTFLETYASVGGGALFLNTADWELEGCVLTRNIAAAGGGLLCHGGNGLVKNCAFHDNFGGVGQGNGPGAGTCVMARGRLTILNSSFVSNIGRGGGVSAVNGSTLLMEDCELTKNESDDGAGGGLGVVGSWATVRRCRILDNEAFQGGRGGGVACVSAPLVEIEGCIIERNVSEYGGGGLLVEVDSHVVVRDSRFTYNRDTDPGKGGGIHVRSNGRLEVYRSSLDLNIADDGGAISVWHDGHAEFHSCLITRNLGRLTMAIQTRHRAYLELRNCTVANNPGSWSDQGAIFWQESSRIRIVNSIVWGRGDGSREPVYEAWWTDPAASFEVSHSIVQGPGVEPGPGNSNADPQFVNVDRDFWQTGWQGDDDFRLEPGSPALDAGIVDGAPDLDLDGKARPCLGGVDLGAYELGGCEPARLLRGDSDGSGSVDIADAVTTLEFLFSGSRRMGCLDAADAQDDGEVNIVDAVYLLLHLFLGGPPPRAPHPECGVDLTADGLGCESTPLRCTQ